MTTLCVWTDPAGAPLLIPCDDARTAAPTIVVPTAAELEQAVYGNRGLPLHPPGRYFTRPDWLQPGQKLTLVTDGPDAGRVAGYVAPWGQCLLGGGAGCWTAPRSVTGYAAAMQGHTLTEEGDLIATANIGGGINHAPIEAGAFSQRIVDHYANTASQLMRVVYGEDEYGIWTAGAVWPDLSDRQLATIQASAVSGDWRWRAELQAYDMAGVQLVSVPGFPLLRGVTAGCAEHPILVGGMGGSPDSMLEEAPMACTCGQGAHPAAVTPDLRAIVAGLVTEALAARTAAGETMVAEVPGAVDPAAPPVAPPAPPAPVAEAPTAPDPVVTELGDRVADIEGAVGEVSDRLGELEAWIAEQAAQGLDEMEAAVAAPSPRPFPPKDDAGDQPHAFVDKDGDGKCDDCGKPEADHKMPERAAA